MSANLQPVIAAVDEDNRLGTVLVRCGKLKAEDLERIAARQARDGCKYGEAAVALGLVSEADIVQAVAKQFNFPCLDAKASPVSPTVIAAYSPFSQAVEQLRHLRNFLGQKMASDNGMRMVAMVSVQDGEGRSWVTANLAVLFSQMGKRTIVFDCNLRNPAQAQLFGIDYDQTTGLSSYLARNASKLAQHRPIEGLPLTVVPAGIVPPNPQELLSSTMFSDLLALALNQYDVVLLDTAAGSAGADSLMVGAMAGACVMVQRRDVSRIDWANGYATELTRNGGRLLGTVFCDG